MNNFNPNFKQFIKKLRSVSLARSERAFLRDEFLVKTGITSVSKPQSQYFFLFQSFRVGVAVCLVFVASGGLAVYASTHALPGDLLYPLKTNVEEPIVRAFMYNSPKAKAEYEVQLVDERLSEAEKLNNARPLSSDQKIFIQSQIKAQEVRAENALKKLKGNDEANAGNLNATTSATTTLKVENDNQGDDNNATSSDSSGDNSSRDDQGDRLTKILHSHSIIMYELKGGKSEDN
ncbi:TPA: hypothetical protein DCQ44_01775 [Candidatus Taylorbacteria bacterium]|nr:hypothetical protein [Candidatus Taylorbacteria bacterium]